MENDTRKLLNDIYATLKNSQRDYQKICRKFPEDLESCSVKGKFQSLFAKRQQMIDAIEEEAEAMGEKEEDAETLLGTAQELLADIKFFLAHNNINALLREIAKDDYYLADAYKKALRQVLPLSLESLLQYQFKEVQKDLKEMHTIHAHFHTKNAHHLEMEARRD